MKDLTFLKLITPTNLASEKRKFFKDKKYNPVFSYIWQKASTENYEASSASRRKLLEAIFSQNEKEIVASAQKHFQTTISKSYIELAKELTSKRPSMRFKPNPEGFKRKFERALKFFGIDYDVVLAHEHGYNYRPKHKHHQLWVSKFGHRDFFSLDGSVKHEMVHVIRAVNGEFNDIVKAEDFLPTEEGLACLMQDYYGRYPKASRFQHAAEYLATQVGLRGSLRDIYQLLRFLGFPKNLAWQRAVRHKFGFVDTSAPGDIMKPAMYFHHEQKLKSLSKDKLLRLFVGKVAIDELGGYRKYKGLIQAEKIKGFFKI